MNVNFKSLVVSGGCLKVPKEHVPSTIIEDNIMYYSSFNLMKF